MKIALHPYASEWPVLYEYEKYLLLQALDIPGVGIEHIGSTAVPGLSAKPVIDILIGLPDGYPLDSVIEPLFPLGYSYIRYYERFMPERRFLFRTDDQSAPGKTIVDTEDDYQDRENLEHTHHFHVVSRNSQFWGDHIKFRDHLRNNPADRLVYELLKKQLAHNDWESVNDYARAKTSFIKMILTRP